MSLLLLPTSDAFVMRRGWRRGEGPQQAGRGGKVVVFGRLLRADERVGADETERLDARLTSLRTCRPLPPAHPYCYSMNVLATAANSFPFSAPAPRCRPSSATSLASSARGSHRRSSRRRWVGRCRTSARVCIIWPSARPSSHPAPAQRTQAINEGDWVAVQEAWNRLDDATNAMPLYTSAVEGARSRIVKGERAVKLRLARVRSIDSDVCR